MSFYPSQQCSALRLRCLYGISENCPVLDVSPSDSDSADKNRFFGDFLYVCGSTAIISNPISRVYDRLLVGHASAIVRVVCDENRNVLLSLDSEGTAFMWSLNSVDGQTGAIGVSVEQTRIWCAAFFDQSLFLVGADCLNKNGGGVLIEINWKLEAKGLEVGDNHVISKEWAELLRPDHTKMIMFSKSVFAVHGNHSVCVLNTLAHSAISVKVSGFSIVSAGFVTKKAGESPKMIINTKRLFYSFKLDETKRFTREEIKLGADLIDHLPYRGYDLGLESEPIVQFFDKGIVVACGRIIRLYDSQFVLKRKVDCLAIGKIVGISVRRSSNEKTGSSFPDLILRTTTPWAIVLFESEGEHIRIARKFATDKAGINGIAGWTWTEDEVGKHKSLSAQNCSINPILFAVEKSGNIMGISVPKMQTILKGIVQPNGVLIWSSDSVSTAGRLSIKSVFCGFNHVFVLAVSEPTNRKILHVAKKHILKVVQSMNLSKLHYGQPSFEHLSLTNTSISSACSDYYFSLVLDKKCVLLFSRSNKDLWALVDRCSLEHCSVVGCELVESAENAKALAIIGFRTGLFSVFHLTKLQCRKVIQVQLCEQVSSFIRFQQTQFICSHANGQIKAFSANDLKPKWTYTLFPAQLTDSQQQYVAYFSGTHAGVIRVIEKQPIPSIFDCGLPVDDVKLGGSHKYPTVGFFCIALCQGQLYIFEILTSRRYWKMPDSLVPTHVLNDTIYRALVGAQLNAGVDCSLTKVNESAFEGFACGLGVYLNEIEIAEVKNKVFGSGEADLEEVMDYLGRFTGSLPSITND